MRNLKANAKVRVCFVRGYVVDLGVSDISAEAVVNLIKAALNFFNIALCEHLDGAIGKVTDEAGNVITRCNPIDRPAKTDALNTAFENDMFCRNRHRRYITRLHVPPSN